MFARLCAVVGLDAPTSASRATSRGSRTPTSWRRRSRRGCASSPPRYWLERLRAAKVPAGPINGIDEAFALAEELGMEPSQTVDGVPLVSPPLRIDGERPPIRHRPPRLGEHDDDLRAWLRSAGRG